MRQEPYYEPGDLLRFNYEYIQTRNKERREFHKLNSIRKKRGLPKIDIMKDVFIVRATNTDIHTMKFSNGEISVEKISFVSCYLQSENTRHIAVDDPDIKYKLIYRPSYMWLPADVGDFKMHLKELAITRSCPFCDKRISVYDASGQILIICKNDLKNHSLKLKSQSIHQFPNTVLDFGVVLKISGMGELTTTSHRNGNWLLDGKPFVIGMNSSPTLIEAVECLKKLKAFW